MNPLGILAGLGAAFFASVSYLYSRRAVAVNGGSARQLLIIAHLLMAIFSLMLLPFVGLTTAADWERILFLLFCCAGFYLAAQVWLFFILKTTTASNISPLLGLKILIAAGVGIALGQEALNPQHWIGAVLAVAATLSLRNDRDGIHLRALGCVILICCLYCGSDYSIRFLVSAVNPSGGIHAVVQSVVYVYILCGLLCLVRIKEVRSCGALLWRAGLGFAVSWYLSMLCLFYAFASIGVVRGVILQSSRGMISVLFAILLSSVGFVRIEEKISRKMRLRQCAAAVMMLGAIILITT